MLLELFHQAATTCTAAATATCEQANASGLPQIANLLLIIGTIFLIAARWHLTARREAKHGPAPKRAKRFANTAILLASAALTVGVLTIFTGFFSPDLTAWLFVAAGIVAVSTSIYLWGVVREIIVVIENTENQFFEQRNEHGEVPQEWNQTEVRLQQSRLVAHRNLAARTGRVGQILCVLGLLLLILNLFI